MVSFKFSVNPIKIKEKQCVVISTKCIGIVRVVDNIFKVEYNDKLYNITEESYKSKGKKIIYTKYRDEYNHRIKIIRDIDSRNSVDSRFYLPFAEGIIVEGKLIKIPLGSVEFYINKIVNK